jgi:cell division protein ZapA
MAQNSQSQTVTITLLDKQYQVACPTEEREELLESARLLNQRMFEIRRSGAVIGLERIAIMSALNIAHELVRTQKSGQAGEVVGSGIGRLRDKIDEAIRSLTPSLSQ